MKKNILSLALSALIILNGFAYAQTEEGSKPGVPSLPNGANSLTETYGNWTVNCAVQNNVKTCSMMQQQTRDNQNWLTANISFDEKGNLSGVLILPFGVLNSKPVTLQLDESKSVIQASVRTCVQIGCIVPVSLDKKFATAMGTGKSLNVMAFSSSPDEEKIENMAISLTGFNNAVERLSSLKH